MTGFVRDGSGEMERMKPVELLPPDLVPPERGDVSALVCAGEIIVGWLLPSDTCCGELAPELCARGMTTGWLLPSEMTCGELDPDWSSLLDTTRG